MHQVPLVSVIMMTLLSTSQASEELNYAPTWPSNKSCKTIHVRLAMIQSMLCAYNACCQLVSSVKGMFAESLNTKKGCGRRYGKSVPVNSMETKVFHLLNHLHHSATQDKQYEMFFMPDTN